MLVHGIYCGIEIGYRQLNLWYHDIPQYLNTKTFQLEVPEAKSFQTGVCDGICWTSKVLRQRSLRTIGEKTWINCFPYLCPLVPDVNNDFKSKDTKYWPLRPVAACDRSLLAGVRVLSVVDVVFTACSCWAACACFSVSAHLEFSSVCAFCILCDRSVLVDAELLRNECVLPRRRVFCTPCTTFPAHVFDGVWVHLFFGVCESWVEVFVCLFDMWICCVVLCCDASTLDLVRVVFGSSCVFRW